MSHLFAAGLALALVALATGSLSAGPRWHRLEAEIHRAHPQPQFKTDFMALLRGGEG